MWKNTKIPQYVIKGKYIDKLTFLQKLWKYEFDIDSQDDNEIEEISAVIMWIIAYFEQCGL